jgi:hypothetical protein
MNDVELRRLAAACDRIRQEHPERFEWRRLLDNMAGETDVLLAKGFTYEEIDAYARSGDHVPGRWLKYWRWIQAHPEGQSSSPRRFYSKKVA